MTPSVNEVPEMQNTREENKNTGFYSSLACFVNTLICMQVLMSYIGLAGLAHMPGRRNRQPATTVYIYIVICICVYVCIHMSYTYVYVCI